MAGYKVMLRIFAIVLVLAAIGFGIFYFVAGGFSNSRAAYGTHREIAKSESRAYIRSLTPGSDQMVLLGNYGSVEQDGSNYVYFANYLTIYSSLDYVLNEMGDELYFSPKKASNKGAVESRYEVFQRATNDCYQAFKVFYDSYDQYTSENSSQGAVLTEWERSQLSGFARKVYPTVANLAKAAYDLNDICYDYIIASCYNGKVDGNLKFAMLDVVREHAMAYYDCIVEKKPMSDLNAYNNQSKQAVQAYKNEKSSNFNNELNAASTQYAFKHSFFELGKETKNAIYKSTNKQQFVDSLPDGAYKQSAQQMCTVMGWL